MGPIHPELARNVASLKQAFSDCSDVVFRFLRVHNRPAMVLFIDGLVDATQISEGVLQSLLDERNVDALISEVSTSSLDETTDLAEVQNLVLTGSAVLLCEGLSTGYVLNIRGGERRGVEEPATESVIRGPREGFTENLRTNTALIRFRIRSSQLKMVSFLVGRRTKTPVVLTYLEGLARPEIIEEAKRRLAAIDIDGVLETSYLEEIIEDHPSSPFPQFQYTERPDTAAGQLLEGRFAILVDGTPFALIAPATFWQLMQASEDYYERYVFTNFLRMLRFALMLLALFLPSFYIATITFHPEMLPTSLLLSIAAAREAIPFPVLVEALIMEISFEALREAGVRLPKTVGQAVSILGALVIGQAAVQAGIVSAPMVIVVAMTGIASFTMPRFNLAISIRLLRFPLMLLAGTLGLVGIVAGVYVIIHHASRLQSFGVPYLSGIAPFHSRDLKDIFIRAPRGRMKTRPVSLTGETSQRMNSETENG